MYTSFTILNLKQAKNCCTSITTKKKFKKMHYILKNNIIKYSKLNAF